MNHESHKHILKHLGYTAGWKKFEPVWNFLIKTKNLNNMLPILESILSKVKYNNFKEEIIEETGNKNLDNSLINYISSIESI